MRKERELIMETRKSANIGARLDRLPNSGWHIKMWLVTAFALLVCWSNGIGGSVQNILLNELHWLEPGTKLLAMWGTTYTAGQLFGALVGGPIGDKIGRKKSILLYEIIHIIAMIGGAIAPNIYVLYVFRLVQGFGLGALLVVLFAGFTEYVPGRNRGVWSSRNSFIGNWAHPICNGIAFLIVTTGISYNMNWRIQYMIPSVLSIIASIIIAKKLPESPRWLEAQGRVDEADAILTKIEKEIEASTGKPLPPVTEEPKEVKQLPYSALFKGKLLRRTIVGSLVLIGMNTIQYTLMTGRYNICPGVDFMATQPNYKGALTQYMTHPEEWTYHIPEGMTTMEGALVEPAAVGMHAAVLGGAQPGKSIVILGGGTIGLMVLQACISLGATDITVVDVIEKRLELAKKLGAARVINGKEEDTVAVLRSEEMYGDHGVDLVFEAAGAVFTAQQAVQIVSRGGKIMMVGTQSKPVPIDFLKINREVTIQTSFRYCNNFPQTIEAISSGRFNVKDMVTNIYDYEDVQKAFEEAIDPVKKTEMVKGVIKVAE